MKLAFWPGDVTVAEHGERASLVGLREFTIPTPAGPARLQFLLYRIQGGVKVGNAWWAGWHAQFEEWSFDGCTPEQLAWLREHKGVVRTQLKAVLEEEAH